MANTQTAKVEEVKTEVVVDEKPSMKEKISESKPFSFVRKHAKALVAGAAGLAAVGTAAILAARAAGSEADDAPFDVGAITENLPIDVDA